LTLKNTAAYFDPEFGTEKKVFLTLMIGLRLAIGAKVIKLFPLTLIKIIKIIILINKYAAFCLQ
jgi:hypothetical protein